MQFAGVHYFTKNGSGEIIHDSDSEEEEWEEDEEQFYVSIWWRVLSFHLMFFSQRTQNQYNGCLFCKPNKFTIQMLVMCVGLKIYFLMYLPLFAFLFAGATALEYKNYIGCHRRFACFNQKMK